MPRNPSLQCLIAALATTTLWAAPGTAQVLFSDQFEGDLSGWEVFGTAGSSLFDSGDPLRGRVLRLHPNGDTHVLIRGSARWTGWRLEGLVMFPDDVDNYLGVIYNYIERGRRMDFGNIYIKGNGSYLQVNPHRDYNVGRTLYSERSVPLEEPDAIRIGEWQRFRVEVVGATCHFYVGDMSEPKLTFSNLELTDGAIGLQPRSVGGDVWVDDIVVSSIAEFAYVGPEIPTADYAPAALLTQWQVAGPFARTQDELARNPARPAVWRHFMTDSRGAVVTGRIVDTHGPDRVAYFRTTVVSDRDRDAVLHFSTIDDLSIWVNGRFHWFLDRAGRTWPDFASNPIHEGQRIPVDLSAGDNEIVIRVIGGVYATGGFFARLESGGE